MANPTKEELKNKADAADFETKKREQEAADILERERLQALADEKGVADAEKDLDKVLADKDASPLDIAAKDEAVLEAERVAIAHAKDIEAAKVTAAEIAALPKHGPDVEGQGDKARYIVCLGYPLYHPYQNKLVGQDVENAVTLKMDYWVKTQLAAKLIQVAPEVA